MKERKRGCSLSLTFIFLFICIIGHAAADSDDSTEEDVPGAALLPLKLGHSICALKADEGPCKAIHMRYYFNLKSRECEIFEYGGCHGNENNFLTLEECQKTCVVTEFPVKMTLAKIKKEKPNFCFHEKDPGICRGYFSRYFYNKETKICEIFKYGGCLGNQNNFKNLEECQATCQSSSNFLPIAPTEHHPNTVNSSSPEEEPNQFPDFFVNLLPAAPNEEQSNIINGSFPEEEHDQIPRFFVLLLSNEHPAENEDCSGPILLEDLSFYSGEVRESEPKYQTFRFEIKCGKLPVWEITSAILHIRLVKCKQDAGSKASFQLKPPPIPSLCMTPMDRGLCRAKERRFFYNYSTGKCRPFNYSGCGGNENNFTSRKSCLSICKKGFIKKKSERRLIKIKKKRKKQSVKVVGDEVITERI